MQEYKTTAYPPKYVQVDDVNNSHMRKKWFRLLVFPLKPGWDLYITLLSSCCILIHPSSTKQVVLSRQPMFVNCVFYCSWLVMPYFSRLLMFA